MIITHKIKMDLARRGGMPMIDAVQDDKYSRNLEISLYSGTEIWQPPDGTAVIMRYSKSDGYGGEYDTLPDGSAAGSISANILTVALAPQVLTATGPVRVSITLINGAMELSTFQILINVQPNVDVQIADSEDYWNVSGYLPMPYGAKVGQYIRVAAVSENGSILATEGADLELDESRMLPEVSTDDAGKVLKVTSDGAWAATAATEFVALTQAEYDALAEAGEIKDDVVYLIVGEKT